MTNFILIDGSYYIFYRYYAILQWFRFSHPDEEMTDPFKNDDFVKKFKSTFIDKLKLISKKLEIDDAVILVGKDCPREEIWRMNYFKSYKKNRKQDDRFMGGPFFKMAYDENLFIKGGVHGTFEEKYLEADDCIAITTKYILKKYPDSKVWIITSDMDYLQLVEERVKIYNLKFKKLTDSKTCFNNAAKDLFCKIVMGDKSDGIPSIFKKCGKVTAEKCFNDKKYFNDKLKNNNTYDNYMLNKKLIDFNEIPYDLVESFVKKFCTF